MFKKKIEPKTKASETKRVPETAGEPVIHLQKEWKIGDAAAGVKVVALDNCIILSDLSPYSISSLCFSTELCKALANALLQAAP